MTLEEAKDVLLRAPSSARMAGQVLWARIAALEFELKAKAIECEVTAEQLERSARPEPARPEADSDPNAPTPWTDGRQPPAGYVKLPAGTRCRCVRLWQQAIGEHWCCNAGRAARSMDQPAVEGREA